MNTQPVQQTENIALIGTQPDPPFVIGRMIDLQAEHNGEYAWQIEFLMNENLELRKYSETGEVEHIYFVLMIFAHNHSGVIRSDRKRYVKSTKSFHIEILFPDFQTFCRASRHEALKIITQQILRGSALFLPKLKHFDYATFSNDLNQLFGQQGWV